MDAADDTGRTPAGAGRKQQKALSVRQPWAWAILHGGKNVENRSWPTRHRGRIWIHAPAQEEADDVEGAVRLTAEASSGSVERAAGHYREHRHRGAIVGSVDLVDCLLHEELPDNHPLLESRWVRGRWLWVLEAPRPREPWPIRGRLGLWTPGRRGPRE